MKDPSDFLVIAFTLAALLYFSCIVWKEQQSRTQERSRVGKSPLKIFVMVGQSNMEGHGFMDKIEDGKYLNGTLEWMVETYPETYGKLKTEDNDEWKKRDDVWIAYNRQKIQDVRPAMKLVGPLAAGYGGADDGHQMGPELGFGWTVGDELGSRGFGVADSDTEVGANGSNNDDDIDIFLIKVAWGGRSLAVNYRPPSSGGETGLYYEAMLANVYRTLAHLPDFVPGYTVDRGYSLEGFAWHQGWNDGCDVNQTAEYESNMANFIEDVRTDLGVPDLPFVIGVSGMVGWNHTNARRSGIIAAQLAMADASKHPEFAGTVASVETRDFFREKKPVSPGDADYHWNNNCESYWLIGQAMGQAMVDLVRRKNETPPEMVSTGFDAEFPEEEDQLGWTRLMLREMDLFGTVMDLV